jgi:hypothetical protein
MSFDIQSAPGVGRVLLSRSFTVTRSDIFVLVSPGSSTRLPPTVARTRSLIFVRFVGDDNFEIGGLSTAGHGRGVNEMHGVGTVGHVGQVALSETSKFVGARVFPEWSIRALQQSFVFIIEAGVWVDGFVDSRHPGSIGAV